MHVNQCLLLAESRRSLIVKMQVGAYMGKKRKDYEIDP